jgi:hypothetical protein
MQLLIPRATRSRWNFTAEQWTAAQAAWIAYLYPSGIPTAGVSTITNGYAVNPLPAGCASVTQYAIAKPGGRVCTEPGLAYLLHPTIAPTGTCLSLQCGHGGWVNYTPEAGVETVDNSIICRALALGWRVLVIPMPDCDYGNDLLPQHITIGGVLTEVSMHGYASLDTDGGPPAARMFTEVPILAENQIVIDYAPSHWIYAGHSGGCTSQAMKLACRSLGTLAYQFCGKLPDVLDTQQASWGSGDLDNYPGAAMYLQTPPWAGDTRGFVGLSAARSGFRFGVTNARFDNTFPISDRNWGAWFEEYATLDACVKSAGGTIHTFEDLTGGDPVSRTGGHEFTKIRLDWMFNDIKSQLGTI